MSVSIVWISCCCTTNNHRFNGFKYHNCVISQILWFSGLGMSWLGPLSLTRLQSRFCLGLEILFEGSGMVIGRIQCLAAIGLKFLCIYLFFVSFAGCPLRAGWGSSLRIELLLIFPCQVSPYANHNMVAVWFCFGTSRTTSLWCLLSFKEFPLLG